jgi:hypothetical protein
MTLPGPAKGIEGWPFSEAKDWPVLRTQGDRAKSNRFLEWWDHAEALGEHIDDSQFLE